MWPVDDPPKPRLHTTIDTVRVDRPLNVVIALHALRVAAAELRAADPPALDKQP